MADTEYAEYTPAQVQQIQAGIKADSSLSPTQRMQALQQLGGSQPMQGTQAPESPTVPEAKAGDSLRVKVPVQTPSQPMDIGPGLSGSLQGLGQSLSGHIYNPQLTPQQQPAAGVSKWLGDLGTDIGVGAGGAAAGALAGEALFPLGGGVPGAIIGAGGALYGKHFLTKTQDEIHEHPGQPVNWGAVNTDAAINGVLGAVALGEGSLVKKILLDGAIGGTGGAALNASDQYFNKNGHVDPSEVLGAAGTGALGGALLPLGIKGLGKVGSKIGEMLHPDNAHIGVNTIRESAMPKESNPGFEKDPATGQYTPAPKEEIHTESANTPEPTEGGLTARISNVEGEGAAGAPWDRQEIEAGGGGTPAPPLSPETGQPVQGPNSDLNATSALQQIQQRRAMMAQMQQQAAEIEARQQQNQQDAKPSVEAVNTAQGGVEQMLARRQAIQQAEMEQSVQQKADELHGRLTNLERMGSKPQAAKLKAEIAEQAAMHQDPVQRAAYQRALDKYAPPKVEAPKQAVSLPEQKPVEQPKVTLPAKVEKTANEPQGEVQQPEGKQPTPGKEKAPKVAEQKPAGAGEGKTKVKAPSATKLNAEKLDNTRTILASLMEHPEFSEQPATDFLKAHDIPYEKAPNTGHVLHYQVFIPGEGMAPFKYNAPLSEIKATALAGMVHNRGGLPKLLKQHADLNLDSNNVLEKLGKAQLEAHEQDENNLLASFDKHLAALKKADTFDEIERIHAELENPAYQHIYHGEVREEVTNEVNRAIERSSRATAGEERSASHGVDEGNSADAGSGQGKTSEAKPLKASATKTQDSDYRVHEQNGSFKFQRKVKDFDINGKPTEYWTTESSYKTEAGANKALAKAEEIMAEDAEKHKTHEIDQEALDAISKPADTEKDSLLAKSKKKTEPVEKAKPGAPQREHLEQAQAHKSGEFLNSQELEAHPDYAKGREKLTDKGRQVLDEALDALDQKKKVYSEYYQPKTKTKEGVLTKRAGYQEELYTPKGFTINKDGSISIKGYNENAEISTRDPNQFTGSVKKTTDTGYEGLYRHPSDVNATESFHPADAIVEQVANPFIKKQFQGKPVLDSDYQQAYKTLRTGLKEAIEANPESMTQEKIEEILKKLPDPVTEHFRKNPCTHG